MLNVITRPLTRPEHALPLSQTYTVEHSFLAYLRGRCRHLPQVTVGIGDDAAVIEAVQGQQIACVDQIIDGVDFLSSEHRFGRRRLYRRWQSTSVTLPRWVEGQQLPSSVSRYPTGTQPESPERCTRESSKRRLSSILAIAGGDISTYDGPLAISVTLLGYVEKDAAFLRTGAVEGDAILVSGAVGGSILGRHLRPKPRLSLAQRIREQVQVTAAIDISDGLSLDLDRLCAASGVGAELDTDRIPIHQDAHTLSATSGRTPFQHAWSDGEDFELLITMKQEHADVLQQQQLEVPLTQIGNIVGRTGLWKREQGNLKRLSPQGYLHDSQKTEGSHHAGI